MPRMGAIEEGLIGFEGDPSAAAAGSVAGLFAGVESDGAVSPSQSAIASRRSPAFLPPLPLKDPLVPIRRPSVLERLLLLLRCPRV